MRILLPLIFLSLIHSGHAADRPNFVIFYVDDLGWADTSVRMMDSDPDSASDFHQTPHLEKLAARGMKFSAAYAPAPTCTPSRKSIQFGKTPGRLGYTFVHDVLALEKKLEWKDEVSLADILKTAEPDYITAHFGKGMSSEQMRTIGYDVTDEVDGKAGNGNFHGDYISLKDRTHLPPDNPKRMPELKKRSVEFVEEHSGKRPFFLMVSQYAVHVPHAARPELIEKYRKLPRGKHCKDDDYLPTEEIPKGKKVGSWRLQYAAMLEEVDEGGLRVPFVVAGPGVKAGDQCDIPVSQWDLLSTWHDLSGSEEPLPENLDGGSLREVFEKGNDGKVNRPVEGFVFHYPCYFAPPLSVIRLGDYKLMEHHLTGQQKLYNIATDYQENHNLIYENPKKALELKAVMDEYLQSIDAEKVEDVYRARFAELDRFEEMARKKHRKEVEKASGDATAIADADDELQKDLERFEKNRKECQANMNGITF